MDPDPGGPKACGSGSGSGSGSGTPTLVPEVKSLRHTIIYIFLPQSEKFAILAMSVSNLKP
jgi:hypothetical protein